MVRVPWKFTVMMILLTRCTINCRCTFTRVRTIALFNLRSLLFRLAMMILLDKLCNLVTTWRNVLIGLLTLLRVIPLFEVVVTMNAVDRRTRKGGPGTTRP